MKRSIALLLFLGALLAGCAAQPVETVPPTTSPVQTQPSEPAVSYPVIHRMLTRESLDAFPRKSADMTTDALRMLCVDFFRFSKNALWTPSENLKFISTSGGRVDEFLQGTIYGGVPYVSISSGNVYRLLDYMDPETGVLDIRLALTAPKYFGNQCSIGSYWAWARVINSADFQWTQDMVASRGFLPLGPYTYDTSVSVFSDHLTTKMICRDNGEQTMYRSYAQLLPADGLVMSVEPNGHAIMCSSVAHVEYIPGTDLIDGEKSYITIIDQHTNWAEATNDSGDTFLHKNYMDKKRTFSYLFEEFYIPFTFAEFQGTNPVEETECSFSHTGDTITVKALFSGKVTSNYGISDIYAIVRNAAGEEVYRHAVRCRKASTTELALVRNSDNVITWGKLELSEDAYTVEISAQLATGERPTIYTGKLVP